MDNETRQSDREALISPDERRQVHDDPFKTSKKLGTVALKRKMDVFENQMATIHARLEARREIASPQRDFHLPVVNCSSLASSTVAEGSSIDRLKLPLLRQIELTRVANAPPKDPFLDVENVLHRTFTREMYVRDADAVATKELVVVSATKEAQQLGEEARKRMVAYTQNESGWKFEERTTRYQQVMEIKQQAEKAQQEADLQRETVRQMKGLLRDPYGELRSSPVPRNALTPVASSPTTAKLRQKEHYEWIWVLASPSTKLSFTPREETPDHTMDSEKELSMYVVYYIAGSEVNCKPMEHDDQLQDILSNDCPPTAGWMCCSMHGVPPAPELTAVRSGIQTWTVTGAGAGHLNGKYVACGVHDHVRRFKSTAGVELFRKCVPMLSTISQALHGGETVRPESASSSVTDEELRGKEDTSRQATKTKPSDILPSGLASIEKDEHDFRSMQRVGSWLSMNASIERNRRMLARRSSIDAAQMADTPEAMKQDGSRVLNQESREMKSTDDVAESRPDLSASLCREWVLFSRCSRRRAEKVASGASEPPMKGIGLGCLKRHYFISLEEKAEMTIWVQTKESWLEKNVLTVIIEREAQMYRVHHLSRKCMVNYQQNLRAETEKSKVKLLAELNRVRFLTVKVLETIDLWRQHTRKIGFARYDSTTETANAFNKVDTLDANSKNKDSQSHQTEALILGWSSSITLETGKQLYKGSKAFVSKVKRFRRSEDIIGKREQHIVYLGYFATQEEAERAYDEHAASEARLLNTTVEHLPRRRNVFRSCGKHFAVESEKDGPSFCIECKTKQLASLSSTSVDEWIPPFYYGTGLNYIMKMANDLEFLDDVLPLKAALNNGRGIEDEAFPMRGNIFLLPKTPIQDPDLAVFTTFPTPTAPRLGESPDSPSVDNIDDEALDRGRIFKAQQIFLQELQIYRPELIAESLLRQRTSSTSLTASKTNPQYRLVEALYWDHCAALKIQQERPPLALRQSNIWCRPDVGEWANLVVRGANQLHFLFEEKLEKTGKEMVQRRQQVLSALRQLNKVPLYFISSRTKFTELIGAGQSVRGDVVQLEVNNATKRLQRYDSWCTMSLVVQRWFRGVLGRHRARATRKALRFACKLRVFYANQVATVAKTFYDIGVRAVAVRRAYKAVCTPVYTRVVLMNGELVTIMFHSLRHYQLYDANTLYPPAPKRTLLPSFCCTSCARRFHVKVHYQTRENRFEVLRGVCTCTLNGGSTKDNSGASESWLIRAYSSSHNVIYRLRLDTPQLQHLISSQSYSHLYPQSPTIDLCPLIMDMETKQLAAAAASKRATFCFQNAECVANNLANWRRMNSEATQTRKSLMVELDKNLALLDRTQYAHAVSVGNAKKALDFASRPFSESQAWDPLENANDWRFIVEKRQLVKRLEEVLQEVERLRVAHFQATYNDQYTRAGAALAQEEYNRIWLPLVQRESQAMEEAILFETTAETRTKRFMGQLCDRFLTLRDGYCVPTRRNLVIQSPVWHDMTPFRLDIPGLRRRLNHLRTRTLVLSNQATQCRKTRRMIVTASMWPLVERSNHSGHTKRDFWVTAYDPVDCSVHNIFLEWELVQLLTGPDGRKIWQDSTGSKRSACRSIADMLLSLTMLDRFTGVFTLQKLQFYHTLRRLSPQFLSSRVMRDLQTGRKCGQGDEILRQGVAVDGRLCVVVVYENWGDLTFAIYHTASGDFFRLVVPLSQVFDLLSGKPLMLRLWICCVKSNSYAPTLLTYLLKYVRFCRRDDECEYVQIEHGLPAQKRSKRYQTVLRIQNRKLLLSITEDNSGDFFVTGYDMTSEIMYKLLLERESLHRVLKTSAEIADSAAGVRSRFEKSSSSLLLRRNRKLLYEWICSRLRFQSMLEHPEIITSGASPVVFGLHLRESFRILNRWIDLSLRNPLHAVTEVDIARWASSVDAAAFSSLQFDQLTLIGHSPLPFALEKEYVGTINWVEALAGPPSQAQHWKKELPYMRMDFFVKAHTLFARIRGELEAEAKERRKRENWAGMEQEDHNSLCLDIATLMKSAKEHISSTCQRLSDLHATATKWIDQWRQIHSELRVAAKSDEQSNFGCQGVIAAANGALMIHEDSGCMFLGFLHLWISASTTNLVQFISLAIPFDCWRPVLVASSLLQACLQRWEYELKTTQTNLETTFEQIERSEYGLEDLRMHKARVMQFSHFVARQATKVAINDENEGDEINHHHEDTSGEVKHDELAGPVVAQEALPTTGVVNTGVLIPCNTNEPFQEVFLADMPTWSPLAASSFVDHARAMVKQLRSFFQQLWRQQQISGSRFGRHTSNASEALTCQRVPYGVLVYQIMARGSSTKRQVSQLNSRAAGLTGGVDVCGPALFWPLQVGSSWYQRLMDCSGVFRDLALDSDALEQEDSLKRPAAVRSTNYLPWKQYAIERLRVARAVKRSRTSEGMCVDSLANDLDDIEKEKQMVTSVSVDLQQLEISLGKRSSHELLGSESATKCMRHLFRLQKDCLQDSSVNWRVSIANPRAMHRVLDIYDADGCAIQIPCAGCAVTDMFNMEGIRVEIDDEVKPRCLIFSYRNLQTQRIYFVNCDYYSLQYLLHQRSQEKECVGSKKSVASQFEAKWRNKSAILTIQEWRKLAAFAAQFLVFRKKNGALSLCLELYTPEVLPQEEFTIEVLSGESSQAVDNISSEAGLAEKASVQILNEAEDPLCESAKADLPVLQTTPLPAQCCCRPDILEEHNAVKRALDLHFQKNQPALRAAACGRILARTALPSDISLRMMSEWMQMTREDWRAQELRGILVLDGNVLTQIEKAHTPATRRAREYLNTSNKEDDIGGLELQMREIVKAMGETEFQPNDVEILQSIRMTRWRRRGKEASGVTKRAEAYLADVAEWWRRRLTTKKAENK